MPGNGVSRATTRPPPPPKALIPSVRDTEEAIEKVDRYVKALSSLHRRVPPVVTFCVDGRRFAVLRDLLMKDPQSLLFVLASEHYARLSDRVTQPVKGQKRPREEGTTDSHQSDDDERRCGIVIPNRDPQVFAMLLNMLRGYRHAIPDACMDACREEATFYGLQRSWSARYGATTHYQFKPSVSGTKINSDAVCAVASDYFGSGQHTIDLSITQCDRVGVGVMSEGVDLEDRDALRMGFGCALYWNDGKVSTNFGNFQMSETGKAFKAAAIIQVTLDADEGIVSWMLADDWRVASLRLPAGQRFAFAVMVSRLSQVNIMPSW